MAFIRSETENRTFSTKPGAAGKLRSRAGETLAETLVALLIAVVGLMMLAGMISSSAALITRSRKTLQDYYKKGNELEMKGDVSSGSFDIVLRFDKIEDETVTVNYYKNEEIGSKAIISYKGGSQ